MKVPAGRSKPCPWANQTLSTTVDGPSSERLGLILGTIDVARLIGRGHVQELAQLFDRFGAIVTGKEPASGGQDHATLRPLQAPVLRARSTRPSTTKKSA
jgi:hypothetical protein